MTAHAKCSAFSLTASPIGVYFNLMCLSQVIIFLILNMSCKISYVFINTFMWNIKIYQSVEVTVIYVLREIYHIENKNNSFIIQKCSSLICSIVENLPILAESKNCAKPPETWKNWKWEFCKNLYVSVAKLQRGLKGSDYPNSFFKKYYKILYT